MPQPPDSVWGSLLPHFPLEGRALSMRPTLATRGTGDPHVDTPPLLPVLFLLRVPTEGGPCVSFPTGLDGAWPVACASGRSRAWAVMWALGSTAVRSFLSWKTQKEKV